MHNYTAVPNHLHLQHELILSSFSNLGGLKWDGLLIFKAVDFFSPCFSAKVPVYESNNIRDVKFVRLRRFWTKTNIKYLGGPATIAKLMYFNLFHSANRTRFRK